jgi:hypothetical protein
MTKIAKECLVVCIGETQQHDLWIEVASFDIEQLD